MNEVEILVLTVLAADRRNDPARHCAVEAVRIAYRQNEIADAQVYVIGKFNERLVSGLLNFQNCKIRQLIRADNFCVDFITIGEPDADDVSVCDDVIVGDDVAVGINKEPGALRFEAAHAVIEPIGRLIVRIAEPVIEELLEAFRDPRRINFTLDENADHRGADPLDEIGERKRAVGGDRRRHQARRLRAGGGRDGEGAERRRDRSRSGDSHE